MSFSQLVAAATIISSDHDPLHRVHEWATKRETLKLQLLDLPFLVSEFKKRKREQHPTKPQVMYIDNVPMLRLANACESTCHGLYATAEVAAGFANKISDGVIPASFNALRKKIRKGDAEKDLISAIADVEWYEKVREMRTEWTHHSSVFIGESREGEPLFVMRSFRRTSDKEHFPKESQYSISHITHWTMKALALLDSFGSYLLKKYVLPSFNLDAVMFTPKKDAEGIPVFLEDGRFDGEHVTIRQYLLKNGVDIP